MFRNLFYKPHEIQEKPVFYSSQPEVANATTRDTILETQVENTFDLIEEDVDKVLQEDLQDQKNHAFYEDRMEFLYQLLGTIIVEKNSEQFQRKIDIDIKLKECRYRLEKAKHNRDFVKLEESLDEKLNSVLATLETIQNTNVEIDQRNGETIRNIRKILVVLKPKAEPTDEESPEHFTHAKQVEGTVVNKLRTFSYFWATIRKNLHPNLAEHIKDNARHVLQNLSEEIAEKLREFQPELRAETEQQPEGLTYEILQIAKKIIALRDKVKHLLGDIENSDASKYEKLRKTLDKCQDKFEEVESHTNPEIVALRTETFDLLLKASRILNERYA